MNAELEKPPSASRQLSEDPGIPVVQAAVCAGTVETHYRRAGNGSAVVLLHGAGKAPESLYSLVDSLSARFRVILPQEVRCREPHGAGGATWLRDFLDGLGLQRVALVAIGEGEAVALDFMREEPERVEQLVLVGTVASGGSSPEALGERVIGLLNVAYARVAGAPGAAALP